MVEFHQIPFDDIAEAAGLVAALSRQLASPRADLRGLTPIEIGIVRRGSGANVYLSSAALTAIDRAFGHPPNAWQIDAVPGDIVWVLREGDKKFLGRGDVLSLLIPEPSEPLYRTTRPNEDIVPKPNRGGWKTCSRGHKYRGSDFCPICQPGRARRPAASKKRSTARRRRPK